MSPRFQRVRFRKPAGGSSGASTGTALVIELRFNGLSQDYRQMPGGGSTQWAVSSLGSSANVTFPQIPGLKPATGSNDSDDPEGEGIFKDGGVSGSTGDGFFRHHMSAGVNLGGGNLELDFSTYGGPWPEIWLKWSQRYPGGLRPTSAWSTATSTGTGNGAWSYNKDMALNNQSNAIGRVELGQKNGGVAIAGHFDDWGALATGGVGTNKYHANLSSNLGLPSTLGLSWRAQMVGQVSSGDDTWHTYQVHLVKDNSTDDGVYEAWFDGVLVASHSTCRWSSAGASTDWGFNSLRISNNQSAVGTDSTSTWQDYDNILISVVGFITQD